MTPPSVAATSVRSIPARLVGALFSRQPEPAARRAPKHLAFVAGPGAGETDKQQPCLGPFEALIGGCLEFGVEYLSVHLKAAGPRLLAALAGRGDALAARGVALRVLTTENAEPPTADCRLRAASCRLCVEVAVNCSGRGALIAALRRLAASAAAGEFSPADLTPERLRREMASAHLPPVDLLIGAGGGRALSDFLLWHAAYAELLFLERPWAEFSRDDFQFAMADYARRSRTFGALSK